MRALHQVPDLIASLFNFGFATDEGAEQWLDAWNRSGSHEELESLEPDRDRCRLQVNFNCRGRSVGTSLQYEVTNGYSP